MFGRVSELLRRWVQRVPLALPLLAVVAVLLPSWGYGFLAAVLLLAVLLRAYRVAMGAAAMAAVACVHMMILEERTQRALACLQKQSSVSLCGTVVRPGEFTNWVWVEAWRVRLELRGELGFEAQEGDVVEFVALPFSVEPPTMPGLFDRQKWLRGQGVAGRVDVLRASLAAPRWSWARCRGVRWPCTRAGVGGWAGLGGGVWRGGVLPWWEWRPMREVAAQAPVLGAWRSRGKAVKLSLVAR